MDPSDKFRSAFTGADLDSDGCPDPFLTAIRETREELNIILEKEAVTFFGLCRVINSNQPFLLGEGQLPVSFDDLMSTSTLARDLYEHDRMLSIDLNAPFEHVLDSLLKEIDYWGKPSLLGILLSLMKRFGPNVVLNGIRERGITRF